MNILKPKKNYLKMAFKIKFQINKRNITFIKKSGKQICKLRTRIIQLYKIKKMLQIWIFFLSWGKLRQKVINL